MMQDGCFTLFANLAAFSISLMLRHAAEVYGTCTTIKARF